MVFTITAIFLFAGIYALLRRIEALEEAIRELQAKGCLDTTDKTALPIQEYLDGIKPRVPFKITMIHTAPSATHFSDGYVTKSYTPKYQKDT